MKLKIIKTEEEYKLAVNYLEELGDNPDFENIPDLIEKYELLEKLIEDYEKKNYPLEKGDPIEIIKLKMAYMGLKQKDLIQSIGSKGCVSDVLNKKRALSKSMIRNLSELLNISQDILNTEYELCKTKEKTCNDMVRLLFPNISEQVWHFVDGFSQNTKKQHAFLR